MKKEYSELIIGYLQKNLSADELDQFYQWVNESKENKNLFFEVKALYEACMPSVKHRDINKSWDSLLKKRKKSQSVKTQSLLIRWSSVAAALMFLLVVSSLILMKNKESENMVPLVYESGIGGKADLITLPDGSKVYMGSKTTFSYDTDYGDKKRIVYLKGEAYFEVAKQKDKPFIVQTKEQSVEALGTKFNVSAYPEDSLSITTLLEGSVRLTFKNSLVAASILKPDEQLTYNCLKKKANIRKVDAKLELEWMEGIYQFTDMPLDELLYHISHRYNVTFDIHSEELAKHKFSGTFWYGQSIEEILEVINISQPIKYKQTDRLIEISPN